MLQTVTKYDTKFAQKLVDDSIIGRRVLGVYLSGSKLNGLATIQSDTDLIVLVEDTPQEIMTGNPFSKQRIIDFEPDNHTTIHFDIKIYGIVQVWRMICKGNPNFIESFMEKPLAINEADPFMLTLGESQTIAKILHYNLPKFFRSCLGMAKGVFKRKNATIKDYLQAIKNLKYAEYLLVFPTTDHINPDVGNQLITDTDLTFYDIKTCTDQQQKDMFCNDLLPNAIRQLVAEIETNLPHTIQGSVKLDKLFFNKVSQELIKPY